MSRFETGEENAQRFVKVVKEYANEERVVQMFSSNIGPTIRSTPSPRCGWVWMQNKHWRERVFAILAANDNPVKDVRFHKPDSLGDWSFSGISTASTHKVETLGLQDTLAGENGGIVQRAVRVAKPVGVFLAKLAAGLGFVAMLIYTAVQLGS